MDNELSVMGGYVLCGIESNHKVASKLLKNSIILDSESHVLHEESGQDMVVVDGHSKLMDMVLIKFLTHKQRSAAMCS